MELDRHGRIREWSIGWLKIEEISKGFSEVGRSNFQIYLRKETQIETTVCASLSSDPLSLYLINYVLPFECERQKHVYVLTIVPLSIWSAPCNCLPRTYS